MKLIFLTVVFVLSLFPCLSQETNPLFVVIVDDKRGFIDKTGKIVIEPQFAGANNFSEGRAVVAVNTPHYKEGYIDETGKIVIEAKFDSASDFYDGIALVGVGTFGLHGTGDHKFGFIKKDGSWLIEPKYKEAWGFFEGVAAVMNDERKWGFIDKSGKVVIPFQFETGSLFSEGLASVFVNDKYGYIDKTGKIVIEPQFTQANSFSEGLALVKIGGVLQNPYPYGMTMTKKGEYYGKYIFIDKTGKTIIEPKANKVESFSEGLAKIVVKNKSGFIDNTGKVIIKPKSYISDTDNFSEGLVQVASKNGRNFIDKEGNIVFQSDFTYIKDFKNGLAEIVVGDYSKGTQKYGYINKTGKVVWQPTK